MKDYYEILNSSIKDSNRKIYLRFKELAFPLHPDNAIRTYVTDEARFIALNEAYYVLSDRGRKKTYNKIYKSHVDKKSTKLPQEEIDTTLKKFSKEGIQLGNQYYKMPYKNFKKDVPKAHSPIVAAILFLIDLLMLS